MKLKNFFSEAPQWHEKVGGIHALLERVKMGEEQSGDVLRLRKLNRILSSEVTAWSCTRALRQKKCPFSSSNSYVGGSRRRCIHSSKALLSIT